jgi:acetyltransferase-like isoleucine patch superfamily enzyme
MKEKTRGPLGRFLKKYGSHALHLWFEEYGGWITRNLPSLEGMAIRYALYRSLFKRLPSFPLIYPGVYFTHTYGLIVGHRFSVNTGALLDGRGGITIGDGVMIGPFAVIVSSDHELGRPGIPITSRDHVLSPVAIGDDVLIGAHAVILKGVTIGCGAVVAAGAVVSSDVEPYAVVAGIPAKIIESRMPSREESE